MDACYLEKPLRYYQNHLGIIKSMDIDSTHSIISVIIMWCDKNKKMTKNGNQIKLLTYRLIFYWNYVNKCLEYL